MKQVVIPLTKNTSRNPHLSVSLVAWTQLISNGSIQFVWTAFVLTNLLTNLQKKIVNGISILPQKINYLAVDCSLHRWKKLVSPGRL